MDVQGRTKELNEANIAGDHGYDAGKIASGETSGSITNVGPAVMGLVRRVLPQLIAFDIAGVQAMTSSTGQVFALRAIYGGNANDAQAREAFHPAFGPNDMFSGQGAATAIPAHAAATPRAAGDLVIMQLDSEEEGTGTKVLQFLKDYTANSVAGAGVEAFKTLIADKWAVEVGFGMATSVAELQQGFNGYHPNNRSNRHPHPTHFHHYQLPRI